MICTNQICPEDTFSEGATPLKICYVYVFYKRVQPRVGHVTTYIYMFIAVSLNEALHSYVFHLSMKEKCIFFSTQGGHKAETNIQSTLLYRHSIQRQNSLQWQFECHVTFAQKAMVYEKLWKKKTKKKHCIKSSSNISFGYLLESPQRGNSNKYPKHMFDKETRIKQGISYIIFCPLRILYNSKFIIMAIFLGTNAVVITRVHCIACERQPTAVFAYRSYNDVARIFPWRSVNVPPWGCSKSDVTRRKIFSLR